MTLQPNESWNELLAGYVLGDLTPEEAVQVKQYLDTYPELLSEVKALQATLSLLPLALPETSLPSSFGAELVQAAESRVAHVSTQDSASRQKSWRRWMVAIFGVAVTFITIGLGYDSYRLRKELAIVRANFKQQAELATLTQQSNNRIFALKAMDKTQSASGSLVVAPKGQLVLLTIQNLHPLPPGQVYRLWAFSQGKEMTCGDFNANSEGRVFLQMPLEDLLVQTPTVFITIESSEMNPHSKGMKVMVGSQPI
jgi:anti-sigma-K factor RskA